MISWNENLKFSTLFITFLFIIHTTTTIHPCQGGLLSSLVHRYRNFHYVVQSVPDSDNEITGKPNSEEMSGGGEKGTATSSSLSSSSSLLQRIQTHYTDCGSAASIKSLVVSPCANAKKNSDICEIKRGSNVTFNLSFVAKGNATQLKAVIHGIVDYVPIPLPCPEPNACENSGIACPILEGRQYDYKLGTQVKETYPKMKLWVKGQLEDEDERNVICVKIHVHIV